MKSFLLLGVLLSSVMAFAQSDIVCKNLEASKETTIAISQKEDHLNLTIYRTFYGHTIPPQEIVVSELPATRGPVLAYGDSAQNKVLVISLLIRDSKNRAQAIYHDKPNDLIRGAKPLILKCEL